ncbi:Gfo/Idh/MocA family protein [Paenibacillus koleovorans]|uniref:Gfo/Idh/MocA family protein n=1 Tax=Paenibacillus koleovorans TaxID=121608 RepID=UPI000FD84279|nr:Gfo/Idh/MocA family oxidoreductase [Paenibacillus koleovorans]
MKIKIGMIGAGGIATKKHLPELLKLSDVELTAVANRSTSSAAQAAELFGFKRVYEQWTEVIDDPEVNAVFVCTPPYLHSTAVEYALQQGKHVFCQARMAMDLQDAVWMAEMERGTHLTTMLCPPPHYMAVEPSILALVDHHEIGDIRHISISHPTKKFIRSNSPLPWRQRKDIQGINALEIGVAAEVLLKWFGPVSRLGAIGKNWIDQYAPDPEGYTKPELPDTVSIVGQFASGALLTALFTGVVQGGREHMTIYGSEGTITCFPHETYYMLNRGGGEQRVDVPLEQQGRWSVEQDFIEAVRTGKKGTPNFSTGLEYMRFTQTVMDAMLENRSDPVRSREVLSWHNYNPAAVPGKD